MTGGKDTPKLPKLHNQRECLMAGDLLRPGRQCLSGEGHARVLMWMASRRSWPFMACRSRPPVRSAARWLHLVFEGGEEVLCRVLDPGLITGGEQVE
jgi:hypothetical protein